MTEDSLVSISEACRVLGVSEVTLRRWTDEGRISAFITPGGHRRYARVELEKLVGAHPRTQNARGLANGLEGTTQLHSEVARTGAGTAEWYHHLPAEAQRELAEMGRQFLKLVVRYVTVAYRREETMKQARSAGILYGETLAKLGLGLPECVEAFIKHREVMTAAAVRTMKHREASSERINAAIVLTGRIMDESLIALVASYEKYMGRGGRAG